MRLAASAGGAPENVAYVQVLLGDLELQRGRPDAARLAYTSALRSLPGYPAGMVGLARADAAGGDLGRAAARLRRAAERLPLTSTLDLLAQVERALGHPAAAAAALDTARAQQGLFRAAATAPDAEAVLFEADHGSPAAAVALGRRVWARGAERALGRRARLGADALGAAGSRLRASPGAPWRSAHAMPPFRLHAGIAAKAAGLAGPAARHLAIAAAGRPALTPDAPGAAARRRCDEGAVRRSLPSSPLVALALCGGARGHRPPARQLQRQPPEHASASRTTTSASATSSTRPRSPPSRRTASAVPRCCGASARRSSGGSC